MLTFATIELNLLSILIMERTSKSANSITAERAHSRERSASQRAEKIIGTVLVNPETRPTNTPPRQLNNRLETIGHVLVSAESSAVRAKALERRSATKKAESMGRDEVLRRSELIVVDGASLRQVYETHLISEKGLRRIIAEQLAGGDVAKILRRELVEREIDFERDPQLRDRARQSITSAGRGKKALHSLLESAGALPIEVQKSEPKVKQAVHKINAASKRKHRQLIDGALITVIVVLAAAVTYLLMRGA